MHDHHEHHHSHEIMSKEETLATLNYMLQHNRHHAEEMLEIAHNLEHLELADVAEKVRASAAVYSEGNDKLEAAVKLMKGE